jgi:hypothetical protein
VAGRRNEVYRKCRHGCTLPVITSNNKTSNPPFDFPD